MYLPQRAGQIGGVFHREAQPLPVGRPAWPEGEPAGGENLSFYVIAFEQKKTVTLGKGDQLLVRRPSHIVSNKVIDSSWRAPGCRNDPHRSFHFHSAKGLRQELGTIRRDALE